MSLFCFSDTATDQSIVNNAVLSATAQYGKVLAIGSYFFIVYYDSTATELYYRAINITTPTSIGTATAITADMNSSQISWDATVINNAVFVCYNNSSAELSLYSFSSTLVQSSQKNVGSDNADVITAFGDASHNVWVAYAINGGGSNTLIKVFALNNAMSSNVLALTQIDSFQISSVGPKINTMAGIVTGTTATVYYEVVQADIVAGDKINFIKQNTVTTGAVVGTAAVFERGVGLAAKTIAYQGTYFILVVHQS